VAGAWSRRREVVLNSASELCLDGSAAFERLDCCEVVAAGPVSGDRADLEAVRGFLQAYLSAGLSAAPCLRMAAFSGPARKKTKAVMRFRAHLRARAERGQERGKGR